MKAQVVKFPRRLPRWWYSRHARFGLPKKHSISGCVVACSHRSSMERVHLDMDFKTEYATAADFCSLFHRYMVSLYQLAFLLTANHETAERVFVSSLEECVDGNPVFKEHAHRWAKRVIITSAIRVIAPVSSADGARSIDETSNLPSPLDAPEQAVTGLPAFARFVFIMTVLEKVSIAECAVLLRSTREDVTQARICTLQDIALKKVRGQHSKSMQPAATFATEPPGSQSWDLEGDRVEAVCCTMIA
jgi:hypothetical protein